MKQMTFFEYLSNDDALDGLFNLFLFFYLSHSNVARLICSLCSSIVSFIMLANESIVEGHV